LGEGPNSKKDGLCGSSGGLSLLETFTTKHWAALSRLKRDRRFPLTSRAYCLGFHSLIIAAILRQTHGLRPLSLAILATLGFVLELFVVEEKLFACGKNEVCAAINAL